ncbi:MAG: holo-ACP synthase, partial [Atopostipes suicloacalis]|nr:holo-ACP synthase [Atopostipes suicloacalis]
VIGLIEGIGVDLLEIDRIREILSQNKKFPKRILTEKEYSHFLELSNHRALEFLAGRFAAKEAFSKAYGSGIGKGFSFLDLEILPDAKNKPVAETDLYQGEIHLSISHTNDHVIAQVLLVNS